MAEYLARERTNTVSYRQISRSTELGDDISFCN